ncbi:MAG: signal peptidase II [Dehalococcoidia bacterium]|nr:signal peptidase II [Dehalococcoidia bacterium]
MRRKTVEAQASLTQEKPIRSLIAIQRGLMALIALLVIVADQYTKGWVTSNLVMGQSLPQEAPVRLTYVVNTGVAFGLLPEYSFLLMPLAILVIGIVLLYQRYLSSGSFLVWAALGLQVGGAGGNLIDRLRYGYVVDFVDIRVWPVFNLADFTISLGVGLLAYSLIFSKEKKGAT